MLFDTKKINEKRPGMAHLKKTIWNAKKSTLCVQSNKHIILFFDAV